MIVDRTHRVWILGCGVSLAVAAAGYAVYARAALNGPSGGSLVGLVYGFTGYGLMLFAGALGVRTRVPTWTLGRAETWLKGHVWLALLAFPLIWFHAGLSLGGPLTFVLMVLFTVVTASGVLGVVLQSILPRTLMDRVPLETVYEEIDHVVDQMRAEADHLVVQLCDPERAAAQPLMAAGRRRSPDTRRFQLGKTLVPLVEAPPEAPVLQEFYERDVKPFLSPGGRNATFVSPAKTAVAFGQLRRRLPPALHAAVDDLESICEERRQLRIQERLHHWLHGWLLVHVPLSVTLLVLSAIHAIVAFRY